ncbi:response regulator [Acidaminobacterium chupaoyuni]
MMTILAVDDESAALSILDRAILETLPDAKLQSFSLASEALCEVEVHGARPDVAFLDIKMPGVGGLEMAKRIKEASPRTNIVFVTAYTDYALDALALHPSGYLMKPATAEKVKIELENLRYPVKRKPTSRIRIQCFGNFEIFADGRPVNFTYYKSKELLAYLVDRRGAACNTAELCSVLWEDKPDSAEMRKYLRKLLSDLSHSLSAVSAEDIFAKSRNQFAIVPEKVDCDYYGMLAQDLAAINTYTGEYMTQYSWAEMTLGSIEWSR